MKKWNVFLAALLVFGTAATPALAELKVSGSAYVGAFSKYLWRGFDLSPDDNFVVQPGTDISIGNFTVSWWGNFSENTGELNEVDLTLNYSLAVNELLTLRAGNVMYDVDNLAFVDGDGNAHAGKGTTNELYLGANLNTLLNPAVTAYYDYDEFEGNLFTVASVGHAFQVSEKAKLNLGLAASYFHIDKEHTGTGKSENFFHNGEFSAGLDYAITDQLTISPRALFSVPLSSDAEDFAGIDDEVVAGVNLILAF